MTEDKLSDVDRIVMALIVVWSVLSFVAGMLFGVLIS